MNITINQKRFLEAIHTVEHIIAKNTSLPILGSVLLSTNKGKLRLCGTNLEIGIQYWVGAKVDQEGEIAVPMRVLSEFIGSIQDEKVNLTIEKNSLFIVSETSKTQILGMATDEFPIIPTVKQGTEFLVRSENLSSVLARVVEATSLLETRPELTGVFVRGTTKSITCAATDSFRLAECSTEIVRGAEQSFILPRTTTQEIIRIAQGKDEELVLRVGENQIALQGTDIEMVSRLIEGKYPDYQKVIPERIVASLILEKQVLERHVRMGGIFSSTISDVILKASPGKLQLTAKNSDRGETNSQVAYQGKANFTMAVNYRYLLDAIKVLDGNEIELGYTGEGSPLVLRAVGNKQQTYIIMPLRT